MQLTKIIFPIPAAQQSISHSPSIPIPTNNNATSGTSSETNAVAKSIAAQSSILDVTLEQLEAGASSAAFKKIEDYVTRVESLLQRPMQATLSLSEDDQNLLLQYRLLLERASQSQDDAYSKLAQKIRDLLNHISRIESQSVQELSFEDIFGGLSEKQLDAIGRNLKVVQLTTGCSVACPNCNVNALIKPRRQLSWNAINKIADRWGKHLKDNDVFLYYSSDPLDWQDKNGRTYLDVDQLFQDKCGYRPNVTTAVPKGKEEIAKKLWASDTKIRISPSNTNIARLTKAGFWNGNTRDQLAKSLGKSGHSGSHIILSSNDEANGNRRALGKETIDKTANLTYNAGLNYDFKSYIASIGCVTGTYLTPDGVYNFASTATTPITPNGYIRYPIDASTTKILRANYTHGNKQNNLIPYPTTNTDDLNTSQELMNHQAMQAIYEILVNSIYRYTYQATNLLQDQITQSSFILERRNFSHYVPVPIPDAYTTWSALGTSTASIAISIEDFNTTLESLSIKDRLPEFKWKHKGIDIEEQFQLLNDSVIDFRLSIDRLLAKINNWETSVQVGGIRKASLRFEIQILKHKINEAKQFIEKMIDEEQIKAEIPKVFARLVNYIQNTKGRDMILKMLANFLTPKLPFPVKSTVPIETVLTAITESAQTLTRHLEKVRNHFDSWLRLLVHILVLDPKNGLITKVIESGQLPTIEDIRKIIPEDSVS